MPPMLTLQYPVTRIFPGRVFAPIAVCGAIVTLIFLATINSVLAGYETVTVFNSDFNLTQTLWFNRYIPSLVAKPGTLCDPRLLGLGDTFTTNYSLFQYSIASIDVPNAGDSGLSYNGWILDNCDITSLYVNADAHTFIMDFTAVVSCVADSTQVAQQNNYAITARADWSESLLAGKYGTLLGAQKSTNNRQAGTFTSGLDARGAVLDAVTTLSSADFSQRVLTLDIVNNGSFPSIISFQVGFPWCPASLGPDAPCASQIPPVNITNMFEYTSNQNFSQYFANEPASQLNQPLVTNDTSGIISNLVQGVYAAVRLDLGNPSPNNFLLNTSLTPQAITATFPQTFPSLLNESLLHSVLVGDGYAAAYGVLNGAGTPYNLTGLLPLTAPGPAVLQGVYLCHIQRAKSPASAFIAVLVATLSMFSSGWGIFLGLSAGIVKKHIPSANSCTEHGASHKSYESVTVKDAS
ncbi:hypothetical protein K438DRAFT_401838 [Mycena galopus ATCC 62051]|nr:hypothetical protein K438DRAFT_401838 [Mycena galopus ATCC 62051]